MARPPERRRRTDPALLREALVSRNPPWQVRRRSSQIGNEANAICRGSWKSRMVLRGRKGRRYDGGGVCRHSRGIVLMIIDKKHAVVYLFLCRVNIIKPIMSKILFQRKHSWLLSPRCLASRDDLVAKRRGPCADRAACALLPPLQDQIDHLDQYRQHLALDITIRVVEMNEKRIGRVLERRRHQRIWLYATLYKDSSGSHALFRTLSFESSRRFTRSA